MVVEHIWFVLVTKVQDKNGLKFKISYFILQRDFHHFGYYFYIVLIQCPEVC